MVPQAIFWFWLFFGKKQVLVINENQYHSQEASISVDHLFVFFPTKQTPKDIKKKIAYKHLSLAYYSDDDTLPYKNLHHFQHETDQFFRTFNNKTITLPYNICCLPVRFNRSYYFLTPLLNKCPTLIDILFLGGHTRLTNRQTGEIYEQRLEWLAELHDSNLKKKCGIIGDLRADNLSKEDYNRYQYLRYKGASLSREQFLYYLTRSQLSLTPAGNSRWTYRHYESMLTQTPIISTNIRDTELLIPIPEETCVIVEDKQPIRPVIEALLNNREKQKQLATRAYNHITQYIHPKTGVYSLKKPLVLERFLTQLKPI